MMPSRARLASASAAGLVGLVVAGLILFGTDPLGAGSTDLAVPAPAGASGGPSETGTEAADEPTATSSLRPGRSKPTSAVTNAPRSTSRSAPERSRTYRPPTTDSPRLAKRSSRRPTSASSRPSSTSAPTMTPSITRTTAPPTRRPSVTRTPSSTASRSSARPSPTATRTTTSATPSTASPSQSGDYTRRSDWAAAVLDRLNDQRADHGLPALKADSELAAAAHAHNVRMADANELSHQLSGEPGLGDRIRAAGYSWSAVGENVAWNSRRSESGVLALQDAMYNETPPNDGHRRNILSSRFTEVGIDVIEDPEHGKVWLVTDFGRP